MPTHFEDSLFIYYNICDQSDLCSTLCSIIILILLFIIAALTIVIPRSIIIYNICIICISYTLKNNVNNLCDDVLFEFPFTFGIYSCEGTTVIKFTDR